MKGNAQLDISVADINDAVEYWLNTVVLKEPVEACSVAWKSGSNSFQVLLKYPSETEQSE